MIETLPPSLFNDLAVPVLTASKTLMVLSASQLLGRQDLLDLAEKAGGKIVIPSGAMLGLDAIKGVGVGTINCGDRNTQACRRVDKGALCGTDGY